MNRLTKKIATALIGLGALSGTIADANACPGGGGGGGGHRLIGGGHFRSHHAQPRHVQPAPQPYYQQPYYQPAPQQPIAGYGQPAPQFAGQPNGLPPTVKKMASVRPSGAANPQFSQGGQFAPTQQSGQQFAGQPNGGQASTNALQALGGSPIQNQGQPQLSQDQGGQQQFAQSQGGQNQAAPRQMARRPQTQAAQQQTPQSQQQSSSPMGEAQMSALEALGGFDSEEPQQLEVQAEQPEQAEFVEEAQPVQAARSNSSRPSNQQMHVGSWTANLQNGSKVDLTLQPDGNFSWVATSGEKVSSFDGNYTLNGGSLTLVRSSDNQKLIGAMTPAGSSSFTFKLTGTKDAGLNFSRS